MPSSSSLLALATAVSSAAATFQGFNYGSTFSDGRVKAQADYEADFKAASSLPGTNGGFTSARLYTMIQGGSKSDPISAIPAAIKTKTSLLFGMWASSGQDTFNDELAALKGTIEQYCDQLNGLVAGISVGSEDLYRETPTSKLTSPDPGASPDTLVNYVKQVRSAIKGTCLKDVPIGHVDTWTVYINETNKPVIDALDWVGMDAYSYYENTKANSIANGRSLFESALEQTTAVSGGKPVWITETGFPVSGDKSGQAQPSTENAQTFWREVGCPMFGKSNVWWFTLQDGSPNTPNPSFGILGSDLNSKPLYDLSCKGYENPPTSSAASSAASSSAAQSSAQQSSASNSTQPAQSSSAPESSAQSAAESSAPASQTFASQPVVTITSTPAAAGGGGGGVSTVDGGSVAPTGGENTSATPASSTTVPQNAGDRLNALGAAFAGVAAVAFAL